MRKLIVLAVLSTALMVAFLFSLVGFISNRREKDEHLRKGQEAVFVEERNEVFRLYEMIGSAMEADDVSAVCIEASKVSSVLQHTCFRNYTEYASYRATATVYCGTFYRDITNILADGCDEQKLQTIHDTLYKVITLYDENQTSVDDFYDALAVIQEEMAGLAYLY